jgi:hypothetical protein
MWVFDGLLLIAIFIFNTVYYLGGLWLLIVCSSLIWIPCLLIILKVVDYVSNK